MDDDLGTPAAVAAIHDLVREGNKMLVVGASEDLRAAAGSVRAMLRVLGVDPMDQLWAASSSAREQRLSTAVDALVSSLLEWRARARAEKDFAAADAIRDQLNEAGMEIEDTPRVPRGRSDRSRKSALTESADGCARHGTAGVGTEPSSRYVIGPAGGPLNGAWARGTSAPLDPFSPVAVNPVHP